MSDQQQSSEGAQAASSVEARSPLRAWSPTDNDLPEKTFDRLRIVGHCRVGCKGKDCVHENYTQREERGTLPANNAFRGLISHWVLDQHGHRVAVASQRPSTSLIEKYDITSQFVAQGVKAVFNLQEKAEHPYCGPDGVYEHTGYSYDGHVDFKGQISYHEFPFPDMTAPTLDVAMRAVQSMNQHIQDGQGVMVHCHAGLGRTGLMIACWLILARHMEPKAAVLQVRKCRPKSIQTSWQEKFCLTFRDYIVELMYTMPGRVPATRAVVAYQLHAPNSPAFATSGSSQSLQSMEGSSPASSSPRRGSFRSQGSNKSPTAGQSNTTAAGPWDVATPSAPPSTTLRSLSDAAQPTPANAAALGRSPLPIGRAGAAVSGPGEPLVLSLDHLLSRQYQVRHGDLARTYRYVPWHVHQCLARVVQLCTESPASDGDDSDITMPLTPLVGNTTTAATAAKKTPTSNDQQGNNSSTSGGGVGDASAKVPPMAALRDQADDDDEAIEKDEQEERRRAENSNGETASIIEGTLISPGRSSVSLNTAPATPAPTNHPNNSSGEVAQGSRSKNKDGTNSDEAGTSNTSEPDVKSVSGASVSTERSQGKGHRHHSRSLLAALALESFSPNAAVSPQTLAHAIAALNNDTFDPSESHDVPLLCFLALEWCRRLHSPIMNRRHIASIIAAVKAVVPGRNKHAPQPPPPSASGVASSPTLQHHHRPMQGDGDAARNEEPHRRHGGGESAHSNDNASNGANGSNSATHNKPPTLSISSPPSLERGRSSSDGGTGNGALGANSSTIAGLRFHRSAPSLSPQRVRGLTPTTTGPASAAAGSPFNAVQALARGSSSSTVDQQGDANTNTGTETRTSPPGSVPAGAGGATTAGPGGNNGGGGGGGSGEPQGIVTFCPDQGNPSAVTDTHTSASRARTYADPPPPPPAAAAIHGSASSLLDVSAVSLASSSGGGSGNGSVASSRRRRVPHRTPSPAPTHVSNVVLTEAIVGLPKSVKHTVGALLSAVAYLGEIAHRPALVVHATKNVLEAVTTSVDSSATFQTLAIDSEAVWRTPNAAPHHQQAPPMHMNGNGKQSTPSSRKENPSPAEHPSSPLRSYFTAIEKHLVLNALHSWRQTIGGCYYDPTLRVAGRDGLVIERMACMACPHHDVDLDEGAEISAMSGGGSEGPTTEPAAAQTSNRGDQQCETGTADRDKSETNPTTGTNAEQGEVDTKQHRSADGAGATNSDAVEGDASPRDRPEGTASPQPPISADDVTPPAAITPVVAPGANDETEHKGKPERVRSDTDAASSPPGGDAPKKEGEDAAEQPALSARECSARTVEEAVPDSAHTPMASP